MEHVHAFCLSPSHKMNRQVINQGTAHRVTRYYLIVGGAASITALLAGYLWILIARILDHGLVASVGLDVILGFHILAALAPAASIFSWRLASNRAWLYVAICCGLVELAFFVLNVVGVVWIITPGS